MDTHEMITDCDHGKHLELKEEKKKRIVNPSPNYKIQDDDDDLLLMREESRKPIGW